jgi:hypothetical protein
MPHFVFMCSIFPPSALDLNHSFQKCFILFQLDKIGSNLVQHKLSLRTHLLDFDQLKEAVDPVNGGLFSYVLNGSNLHDLVFLFTQVGFPLLLDHVCGKNL